MAVVEAALGLSFLLTTLRADSILVSLSPGGIRHGAMPVGSIYPGTVIQFQSGTDVITTNAKRLMMNALYQCKSVGPIDNPQSVVDLASRIDDVLGGDQGLKNVSVTGGYILSCYRESPLLLTDVDKSGVQYMHLGGLYRIQIQQMP
jgi:hypothetical protein